MRYVNAQIYNKNFLCGGKMQAFPKILMGASLVGASCAAEEQAHSIFHTAMLRSYTILRFIEEEGSIRIFDDYDLQRSDHKGMYVNLQEFHDGMLVLQRDVLTNSLKQRLQEILTAIPTP